MRLSWGQFWSVCHVLPTVMVAEVQGPRLGGEWSRLGWCVTFSWAFWEINVEWLNRAGKETLKEGQA